MQFWVSWFTYSAVSLKFSIHPSQLVAFAGESVE